MFICYVNSLLLQKLYTDFKFLKLSLQQVLIDDKRKFLREAYFSIYHYMLCDNFLLGALFNLVCNLFFQFLFWWDFFIWIKYIRSGMRLERQIFTYSERNMLNRWRTYALSLRLQQSAILISPIVNGRLH